MLEPLLLLQNQLHSLGHELALPVRSALHFPVQGFDLLLDLSDQMTGTTICVLSDSCAAVVVSALRKFRPEFEAYIRSGRKAASA